MAQYILNIFPESAQKLAARFHRCCGIMGAENLQEVPIMKPQFANVFNVSVNDNRSECSLSFYHMYMQHNYTPQPKGLIDMPEKTVGEVASIMLTREGAHALTRLLIQSFGLPEDKA